MKRTAAAAVAWGLALTLALGAGAPSAGASEPEPKPLKVGKKLSWKGKVARRCLQYRPLIQRVAKANGLDSGLLMAIGRIESGFNPDARSRVGAQGLMQVMPSTGRRLKCGDLSDAKANAACAGRLLRKLLTYYKGRLVYAVAGYARGLGHSNARRREGRVPSTGYFEAVMRERSRYLRAGCGTP